MPASASPEAIVATTAASSSAFDTTLFRTASSIFAFRRHSRA